MLGPKNVFELWNEAVMSPAENVEFKIHHAPQTTTQAFKEGTTKGLHFLFDETSLLALDEIGALGTVLEPQERCYILESTFDTIVRVATTLRGSMIAKKAERILAVLQDNLRKMIILQPKDSSEQRLGFELYIDAISQTGAMFITDDVMLLRCVALGTDGLVFGNSFSIIEFLYDERRIDSKEQANFVAAFCQIPAFVNINMRFEFAASILVHCLHLFRCSDSSTNVFSTIWTKIMQSHEGEHAFTSTFRILCEAQQKQPLPPKVILSLLISTNNLLPADTLLVLVASWLVYQCIQSKVTPLAVLIDHDQGQAHWRTYLFMMEQLAEAPLDDASLILPVLQVIHALEPKQQPFALNALELSLAFAPDVFQQLLYLKSQMVILEEGPLKEG